MLAVLPLLGSLAALGFAAGEVGPEVTAAVWPCGDASPCLEVPLKLAVAGGGLALPARAGTERAVPPPCLADVCQARVDVPGFEPSYGKAHKSELFVALLDEAHIEPIATIAWMFVVTGLRVDWTPASMDPGLGATRGGWGNVFVRLRLRIDAMNRVVIPERGRLLRPRFGMPVSAPPS